ncbi:MAG: exodeoxyribonuclease VII large subunit [Evtepia gabavorous]
MTSPAGAAVRDMIRILGSRWPLAEVLVVPVRVQGEEAPQEICQALELDQPLPHGGPDYYRPGRRHNGGPMGFQ